jgi:hypothetical protein
VVRRILYGLIASIVSLAGTLIVIEVTLRILGVGNDPYVRPHPWTGWVLAPGLRMSIQSEDPALGKRIELRTDSLGLRDVERAVEKPAGLVRVLFLGDSYVMAHHVPPESALARRLERALDGRGGRRVEVWNCGVEGYSTSQELLYLQHVAARFHPDLVVLGFFVGNDVVDQVPELATSLRGRPFFRLGERGLTLDRGHVNFRTRTLDWLRTHTRLFDWANARRRVMLMSLRHQRAAGDIRGGLPPPLEIYAEHPDPPWDRAWEITERLIVATRAEARRQGAGFLLVAFPSGVQEHEHARATSPGWRDWRSRTGIALDMPERRLTRLCAEKDIAFLPLLPAFREHEAETGQPLHVLWTGHLNSAGHALAARLVAARIAALLDTLPAPAGVEGRGDADRAIRSQHRVNPRLATTESGLVE